jgi:hypothetical protein
LVSQQAPADLFEPLFQSLLFALFPFTDAL